MAQELPECSEKEILELLLDSFGIYVTKNCEKCFSPEEECPECIDAKPRFILLKDGYRFTGFQIT